MTNDLGRITHSRKTGAERFRSDRQDLGFDLLSFWQWMCSDLVSNVTRGVLAEFLVARALGLGRKDIRDDWAAYDLETPEGVKVEVKSAAFIQTWAQQKPSTISFVIPKTRTWDDATGILAQEARRQADVYVFALLAHGDQRTIDPLNVDQWRFYVVQTADLNARTRSQHSISLRSLEALSGGPVSYIDLRAAVERAAAQEPPIA